MSVVIEIGDRLAALKSSEASDLLAYLKDNYNIEPASGGVAVFNAGPIVDIIEEATAFDVVLTSIDPTKKVSVIKAVRQATGLGLKESKELVEGTPKTVKDGLSKDDAEKLKQELVAAGGTVELK